MDWVVVFDAVSILTASCLVTILTELLKGHLPFINNGSRWKRRGIVGILAFLVSRWHAAVGLPLPIEALGIEATIANSVIIAIIAFGVYDAIR
jgi:hypothetical protein